MSPLWSDWWSENNLVWFTLDAVAQAQMSLSAILGPLAQMRWVGAAGAEPPVLVACSGVPCIFVLFNGCYGLPAAWTCQTDHILVFETL